MKVKSKVLATIMCACLIMSSGVMSFAEETSGLTYDQAVKMAISSNDNLRKLQNEYDALWDQRNSISDGVPESMKKSPVYISNIVTGSQMLEGQARNKQVQYSAALEAIELNLKKIFYSIKVNEENMILRAREISNLQDTLSMQMLKKQYGVSSEFDVKKLQNDLEKAKKDRDASSKEVEKQYFALNKLLGQSTVKYTKVIPIDLEYKPIGEQDAENRIGATLSNSAALLEAKLGVQMLEIQKNLYPLTSQAASMQGLPSGDKPDKISDKISITSDTIKIQEKNLEEQIRTMQNGLKTMELNVKTLETQMKNLDEHLRIAEAQLNAGMIVPKQVEDIKLQKEKLENAIYNLKSQHTLLRLQFEKPYLLGA